MPPNLILSVFTLLETAKIAYAYYWLHGYSPTMTPITSLPHFFANSTASLCMQSRILITVIYLHLIRRSTGLGQLQGGMAMGSFGQLGQQSTGSLGSSLGLGNSGLPINSPSQSVYHTNYGLNSIGKLR